MPLSIPAGLLEAMCGQPFAPKAWHSAMPGFRAEFGEGDDIGIVVGNGAYNAHIARAAAVLNVPGEKFHAPSGLTSYYSTVPNFLCETALLLELD